MTCETRSTPFSEKVTRRALLGAAGLAGFAHPSILRAQNAVDTPLPDDLVKAAQREAGLTYYHNSDIDITARWTAAFTQKYQVATKNMRLPSYPLYDRWLNDERVGRHIADLIQITDPTLLSAAGKQGFVARYIPAGSANIDASLKEEGVWYALTLDYMGIGYNSKKVTADEERLIH